jgi:hypothetical protein
MMMVIGGPSDKGDKPMFGGKKFGRTQEGREDESDEKEMDLGAMGSKRAAKDIIAAIESGDAGALDKALKAHYECCHGGGDE